MYKMSGSQIHGVRQGQCQRITWGKKRKLVRMEYQHLVHRKGWSSHRDWDRKVKNSRRKSSTRAQGRLESWSRRMQPLPDVGKENREKAEDKPTNPDYSLLLPTSLPLDEPNLSQPARGPKWCNPQDQTLKYTSACGHLLSPIFWTWEFQEGRHAHKTVLNDTEDPSLEVFSDFGARGFSGIIGAPARLLGGGKVDTVKLDYFSRSLRKEWVS